MFERVFGRPWQRAGHGTWSTTWRHNIAKFEEHTSTAQPKTVWVHRKGATRAFPPGHPEMPAAYREIGQPVIIPGDMGRG